ncbi:MAG: hypothetical protein R2823_00205 [Acidimicrobiia bacterium]
MTALRRIAIVGGTALVVVGLVAAAAVADELGDYLERVQDSTYTANRLTVSVWGDETQVSSAFVEHAPGSEMVRVDSSWTMAGNGRSVVVDDEPEGVAFVTHADPITTDRYTIGSVAEAQHMRRDCTVVQVLEDGVVRANFLIDSRTGAPLITETYTDGGEVFRRSSLQNFRAYRTYAAPMDPNDVEYEVVMPGDSELLPATVAGYVLVEAFPAPGGAEQGFYSDGLFTFSLFVLGHETEVSGFENASVFSTATGRYDLAATASDVRVHWTDQRHDFVIVGDLPPDHLAEVLAELPLPRDRSVLARLWSKLFG